QITPGMRYHAAANITAGPAALSAPDIDRAGKPRSGLRGTWRSCDADHKTDRAQEIADEWHEPHGSGLRRSLDPGLGRRGAFQHEVRSQGDDLQARRSCRCRLL